MAIYDLNIMLAAIAMKDPDRSGHFNERSCIKQ